MAAPQIELAISSIKAPADRVAKIDGAIATEVVAAALTAFVAVVCI